MINKHYEVLSCLGEGAFGKVYQARRRSNDELVAIKCIKAAVKSWEEACRSTELAALRKLKHSCVVQLKELMLLKRHPHGLEEPMAAELSRQIFLGLVHIHQHGFFHRDIKPENVLYDTKKSSIRIADFGEARLLRARPPFTEYIGTRWYRAPECLLGDGNYSSPVDVWAAGLVLAELLNGEALFKGTSSIDQLSKILRVCGFPGQDWPEFSRLTEACRFQLPKQGGCGLKRMFPRASAQRLGTLAQVLEVNPRRRPTAKRVLEYACFALRATDAGGSASRDGFDVPVAESDQGHQLSFAKKEDAVSLHQLSFAKKKETVSAADRSALNLTAALDEILAASPQKVEQELDLTAELSKMLSDSRPNSADKSAVSKVLFDACSERRGSARHPHASSSDYSRTCIGRDTGGGRNVDEAMELAHELNMPACESHSLVSTSMLDKPAGPMSAPERKQISPGSTNDVATGLATADNGSSGGCTASAALDSSIRSERPSANRAEVVGSEASTMPDALGSDAPRSVSTRFGSVVAAECEVPSRANADEAGSYQRAALDADHSPSMETDALSNSLRTEAGLLRSERKRRSKQLGCLFSARTGHQRISRLCSVQ
eukprot:TRINITY_DN23141_c0_g1_i1.p1 TRINITY_DN23141_c0_g1~~TRINITY_DN23141_c0_g1_i1.p1  ORF type:complete len:604 (-),score=89.60 TRINITY_DN23141_c0_g1_i1:37-1848(-)